MPTARGEDNQDYYYENGFVVFTKSYHLKRGYCCGSNCRHCPYKKEAVQKATRSKKS